MNTLSFVRQSNAIEGLNHTPYRYELEALEYFLSLPYVAIEDLQDYISKIQPGAVLRDKFGLNVRVGAYRPPEGGPDIYGSLSLLLFLIRQDKIDAFDAHCAYEALHPFTDGNGRSGRALWAWQMINQRKVKIELGFLESWYRQSLFKYGKFCPDSL